MNKEQLERLTAREVDMLPTDLQQEWFRLKGLNHLSEEEQAHVLALDVAYENESKQ